MILTTDAIGTWESLFLENKTSSLSVSISNNVSVAKLLSSKTLCSTAKVVVLNMQDNVSTISTTEIIRTK